MANRKIITKWIKRIAIFYFASTILAVVVLRFVPVYFTPLMFIRLIEQKADGKPMKLHHHWVSMDEISNNMPQAVMASEDQLFLTHHGFDLKQIQDAALVVGTRWSPAWRQHHQSADGKECFPLPGHSWIRKGFEAYFTVLIEAIWGKERIMEVYLNSIEMGDGIYGAQAVAQDNFGTTAANLTKRQAALIAATLPNPIRFSSKHPSGYMRERQAKIVSEMRKIKHSNFGC
jgi:monofunctional biosynthetic peptidoglycan transglycosylase